MSLSVENSVYELAEIWDPDYFTPADIQRFKVLGDIAAQFGGALLDVGCGNGLFLKHLTENHADRFARLAGAERSTEALKHVITEKHQASADALPFKDREFDTVTSMEVLEHLPLPIYQTSLSELARISSDRVIVCVPYNQNLRADLSECPHCLARFNANFHVRRYDESAMANLLTPYGFKLTQGMYLGEYTSRPDQRLRVWFRQKILGWPHPWLPLAMCPVCGFHDKQLLANDLAEKKLGKSEDISLLKHVYRAIMPNGTTYRWIAAVYQRLPTE